MNKKFSGKPHNDVIVRAPLKLNWSEYQTAIFQDIKCGSGHTIVEAFAGSAKTTSIIESFKHIPRGKKTLALAFNKIIQEELRARSPSYVETLTYHSIGFRAIKQRFGAVELDDNKVFDIVKSQLEDGTGYDLIINICKTVSFCKYSLQDTPAQIDDIIDNYNIDTCDMDRDAFISVVIKTLAKDKAMTSKINFDDMCYFPFVYNLYLGEYDFVFSDESQDLNKSQLVMAKKACKTDGGRLVMVLDPFQSLYSWRAADTSILQDLRKQEGAKTLPLPISYRCPKSIIELAKKWVPDITCPDTAIEGEIKSISLNDIYSLAKPGCFILSRVNAPLIKICFSFIRLGVKANIRGRDIGQQLGYMIKKSKKKQIPAFLKWLDAWKENEINKLVKKNKGTESILDRYECLVSLCEECKDLTEVAKKVDELFNDSDENNVIILSSVHKSKGLERDNVFILKWTFRVWFDQIQWIEKPNEEANIAYVAITRAKKNLYIVSK